MLILYNKSSVDIIMSSVFMAVVSFWLCVKSLVLYSLFYAQNFNSKF